MSTPSEPHELDRYRQRRHQRECNQRLLRNLPLAHRLASAQATGAPAAVREGCLEQAMVGLVEAVDHYDAEAASTRFGTYATPYITDALCRERDDHEIDRAQARVAGAMVSQQRVRDLASFLNCPVEALVG
jgi:DNA-directed RNA polymerase specialized sigma subunit